MQGKFSARVPDALGGRSGSTNSLDLQDGSYGFHLHPTRIEYSRLGTLRNRIRRGLGTFNVKIFREQALDLTLRD